MNSTNISISKTAQFQTVHNQSLIADARASQLKHWIDENKHLLPLSKSVKIDLSIKETSIRGSVTHFPDA